jgi:alpha,alpha-trehalase
MKNKIQYIHEMGELFETVQLSDIFEDSKTFPDCIPLLPVNEIINRYEEVKSRPDFDLRKFLKDYFLSPELTEKQYHRTRETSCSEHIEQLWHDLTRFPQEEPKSSLLPLPKPYVVPGGRFREVYYWDSYFTMLGLEESGRFDLIESMVSNFAYLIDAYGHIPNGNRSYYIGRSQPPFFALMVKLLSQKLGDAVFVNYLPQMMKEYNFWMTTDRAVKIPDGCILNRYWDENNTPRPEAYKEDTELSKISQQKPEKLFLNLRAAAESGWDFSSRWLSDPKDLASISTTDIIPVDLNCLLFNLEKTISLTYRLMDDEENSLHFELLAENRKKAINQYFWNKEKGFYFDYNLVESKYTASYNLAATYPLFFDLSTKNQALKTSATLESQFLKTGGLITTLEESGQQWDSPNGWAPLQWIAYKGLCNYNIDYLAAELKDRWLKMNNRVFNNTGKMTEKYNVKNNNLEASGGEYPNQDGFGWTNGVFLKMQKYYDGKAGLI